MDLTQSSVNNVYDSDDDNVFGYKSLRRHRKPSKDSRQLKFSQSQTSQTQNQIENQPSQSVRQRKNNKQNSQKTGQLKAKRKKAQHLSVTGLTVAELKAKSETLENDICTKKSKNGSSVRKQQSKGKTPNRTPRKVHEGYCPFCQMPFKILIIETPNWHVTECMQKQIRDNECPDGLECDITIESHYYKFSHTLLAKHRAGLIRKKSSSRKLEFTSDMSNMVEANNEPINNISKDVCIKEEILEDGVIDNSVFATVDMNNDINPVIKHEPFAATPSYMKFKDADINKDTPRLFTAQAQYVNAPLLQDSEQTLLNDDTDMESDNDVPKTSTINPYTSLTKKTTINEETGTDPFTVGQCKPARGEEYKDLENDLSESEDDIFDNLLNQGSTGQYKGSQEPPKVDENRNKVEAWLSSLSTTNTKDLSELLCNISDSDEAENNEMEDNIEEHSTQPFRSNVTTNENTHKGDIFSKKDDINCPEFINIETLKSTPHEQSNRESSSYFSSTVGAISKPFTALKSAVKAKQSSIMGFFGAPDNKGAAIAEPQHTKTNMQPQLRKTTQATNLAVPKKPNKTALEGESNSKNSGWNRQCPFYKKIPGTPFTVDAFRYGVVADCKAYFLTHFHYDHYGGLSKKFRQPIYCSNVTANLVEQKLKVDARYVHRLPMNEPCQMHGVQVTLLEANHCPGAVLILFETNSGETYLHTGDFRANRDMENYPQLINKHIDKLYLDTTYCDPTYSFPPQEDIIHLAGAIAERAQHEDPNTLFVCGTYTIGKERIFTAIAHALGSKVCVTREKKTILDCLDDAQLNELITLQTTEAKVHVLPMKQLNFQGLSDYLSKFNGRFSRIVAFEPTGWTHGAKFSMDNPKPKMNKNNVLLYGLPYSEHSSYTEMKRFVTFIRPTSVLPTVNNGNPTKRKLMEKMFHSWLTEELTNSKKTSIGLKQKNISAFFSKK